MDSQTLALLPGQIIEVIPHTIQRELELIARAVEVSRTGVNMLARARAGRSFAGGTIRAP